MKPIDLTKFEQIKASGKLPSPKGVALAILRLSQKENASMAELARIVKSDPAFVGRLVKAANSVNANPGRPVVSVQDALVVLGLPAVRNLALGLSMLSQYRDGACKGFDYARFWSGSLACGIALQALTQHTRVAQPEEAFSVGLLARIGELAMATLYPDEYARILRSASRQHRCRDLARMEAENFAITHCELAAAMLADWGLPAIFVDPVRQHEAVEQGDFPEGSREDRIARMLALARSVADICLADEEERPDHLAHAIAQGGRNGIEQEELGGLCDRVAAEWREWAGMLNVASQPLPPFDGMVRQQPAVATRSPAGESPDRLRVLVVDANDAERTALRLALESADYEVAEAADGEAGLRLALEIEPHIMMAAGALPRMDGLALIRALRETRPGQSIYLVALTASGDDGLLAEAWEAGADDAMAKPFERRLLLARLQAGRRMVRMQHEIASDQEALRRSAAELAIGNRRLQEVALADVLTGLPNRRHALDRLRQEWASATRCRLPLACIVIDLDELKQVNDIYGRDMGDAFLVQTTAAMRATLRDHEVLSRIGGDRFMVLCPGAELPEALACAERMRLAAESASVESGQLRLKGTLSAGVAACVPETDDFDALIRQAEQCLALAKQRGRNRAVAGQPPASPPSH